MKGMYILAVIFYHDEVSISVTAMIGIMRFKKLRKNIPKIWLFKKIVLLSTLLVT